MDTIAPFRKEDVAGVGRLFSEIFRRGEPRHPGSLHRYLEALYLDNPWSSSGFTSLTSRNAAGNITGFVGAIPRPMTFQGERLMAVVAGNHMVDPRSADPLLAGRLLKRLIAQGQDLTFSDSANPASCRMWKGLGGRVLLLYSLRWIRLIKPLSFVVAAGAQRLRVPGLGTVISPLSAAADLPVARLLDRDVRSEADSLTGEEVDQERFLRESEAFTSRHSLRPVYDRASVEWLASMIQQKRQYGPPYASLVHDRSGVIGAHVFYVRRHATAEVLGVLSRPGKESHVISHLLADVAQKGGVAATGRADPWDIPALGSHGSILFHRNSSTVAHSPHKALLDEITGGNARLSRLEGEWWTRLQGDDFDSDPLPEKPARRVNGSRSVGR